MEKEEVIECTVCDVAIELDDGIYTTSRNTKPVCSDCVRICDRCDEVGTENDSYGVVDTDYNWCASCISGEAAFCQYCEEWTSDNTLYIQDRDAYWCGDCTSDNASWCEECDSYSADSCYTCDTEPDVIHDHNYRPDLIFHTTDKNERLFFGMEIELECRNGRSEPAERANELEGHELAYLKSDGSLSNGFEIVTHPMTHDFFKNEATEFWETLADLRHKHRVMTWGTSTAGIHIHISRTGFNGGPHMHRFLRLVYDNQQLFSDIAGRHSSRWAKFDDVMAAEFIGRDEDGNRIWRNFRSFTKKIVDNRNSDRYSAVNTQNRDTLELRIFKSTTKAERIKAYMDLAHASVEFTRVMSIKQVIDNGLSRDVFISYIRENLSLYEHLNGLFDQLGITTNVRLAEQNASE